MGSSGRLWGRQRGWPAAILLLALAAACCLPAIARAQDWIPPNLSFDEFKLGVLDHDAHFLKGKESGADINPELILQSPVDADWVDSLPPYLRWPLQPRPTAGLDINTSGFTDQAYFGATWTWQLATDVINPGDGFTYGVFFGPGFNDGKIHSDDDEHKSLGGHVLFRVSMDFGYRITPMYQVSAFIDHISNGGLDRYNQSINNVGVRLGVKF